MQIDGVTGEAQQKANETAAKVDELSERLNNLQKNVLKNEFDAKEIQAQSEIVREAANNAHESAIKVTHSEIQMKEKRLDTNSVIFYKKNSS